MQKAIFGSLAALATAETINNTFTVSIPYDQKTWSSVDIQEFAEGEPGNESVNLQFVWTNACNNKDDKWQDGTWVQNFATWETSEPGVYRSVSCAAEYFNENVGEFSPYRTIATYEGLEPLQYKVENPKSSSSFEQAVSEPIFTEIADERNGYRQKWIKKQLAQQNCAVVAEIYSAVDGAVSDQEQSDFYWSLKNLEGPLLITTGYRIWQDQNSNEPWRQQTSFVDYAFFDFGIEEIVPVVPADEEAECLEADCEVAEAGDTIYGIDKLYVFIAAALLVIILVLIIVCCCCFNKSQVQETGFKFGKDADKKPVTVGTRASRAQSSEVQMADNTNRT